MHEGNLTKDSKELSSRMPVIDCELIHTNTQNKGCMGSKLAHKVCRDYLTDNYAVAKKILVNKSTKTG